MFNLFIKFIKIKKLHYGDNIRPNRVYTRQISD